MGVAGKSVHERRYGRVVYRVLAHIGGSVDSRRTNVLLTTDRCLGTVEGHADGRVVRLRAGDQATERVVSTPFVFVIEELNESLNVTLQHVGTVWDPYVIIASLESFLIGGRHVLDRLGTN
jgi:hypothetical protein